MHFVTHVSINWQQLNDTIHSTTNEVVKNKNGNASSSNEANCNGMERKRRFVEWIPTAKQEIIIE